MKVCEILDTIYCYKTCAFCKGDLEDCTISGVTFIDVSRAKQLYPDDAERYENYDTLTKLHEILESEYVSMSLMFDEKLEIIYK